MYSGLDMNISIYLLHLDARRTAPVLLFSDDLNVTMSFTN